MGFGAGTLLSAIAYELVPASDTEKGIGMAIAFLLGAFTFFGSDWLISRRAGEGRKDISGEQEGGSGMSIFLGTLMDGVPESAIIGLTFALGGSVSVAFLVAVFVSNIPEGIAGSINLEKAGYSRRRIFFLWSSLVIAAAVAAAVGYAIASNVSAATGWYISSFAAGAMLTMLANTMIPEAFEHGGSWVGLMTVIGFLVAAILSVVD
jgi:ZIP family zinc transporter